MSIQKAYTTITAHFTSVFLNVFGDRIDPEVFVQMGDAEAGKLVDKSTLMLLFGESDRELQTTGPSGFSIVTLQLVGHLRLKRDDIEYVEMLGLMDQVRSKIEYRVIPMLDDSQVIKLAYTVLESEEAFHSMEFTGTITYYESYGDGRG